MTIGKELALTHIEKKLAVSFILSFPNGGKPWRVGFRMPIEEASRLVRALGGSTDWPIYRNTGNPQVPRKIPIVDFVSGASLTYSGTGYWLVRGTRPDGNDVWEALRTLIDEARKIWPVVATNREYNV